jgi:hypothetical protein
LGTMLHGHPRGWATVLAHRDPPPHADATPLVYLGASGNPVDCAAVDVLTTLSGRVR